MSDLWYSPGRKVVFIDDSQDGRPNAGPKIGERLPEIGKIYTVRSIAELPKEFEPAILLKEITNIPWRYKERLADGRRIVELGQLEFPWSISRFRPATEAEIRQSNETMVTAND